MRATKPDLRRQGSSRARRAPAGRDCKRSRALALLDTRHQAALLLDLAPRQFVLLVLERVVASLETHQQRHALEFELFAELIGEIALVVVRQPISPVAVPTDPWRVASGLLDAEKHRVG